MEQTIRPLDGVRVLVVEDEALVAMLLEDMLAHLGCAVVGTAAQVVPAIQLARTLDFDVALVDLNLAGASGEPVAEAVAARGAPVIYATGYATPNPARRLHGTVIAKPYDLAQLRRAIAEALPARDG